MRDAYRWPCTRLKALWRQLVHWRRERRHQQGRGGSYAFNGGELVEAHIELVEDERAWAILRVEETRACNMSKLLGVQ